MRAYNPLPASHPLVMHKHKCAACGKEFKEGEVTTLIPLGPGDNAEEQQKAREGRPYNAVCAPVHYACGSGWAGDVP